MTVIAVVSRRAVGRFYSRFFSSQLVAFLICLKCLEKCATGFEILLFSLGCSMRPVANGSAHDTVEEKTPPTSFFDSLNIGTFSGQTKENKALPLCRYVCSAAGVCVCGFDDDVKDGSTPK